MKHEKATDEIRELAASYALGALDHAEAKAFEAHLAEGCAVCREETQSFQTVAAELAAAAPAAAAPDSLRERVLARSADLQDDGCTRLLVSAADVVRADDIEWENESPGVESKTLSQVPADGRTIKLVRMEPGVSFPVHRHVGDEEVYILTGDCHVAEDVVLRPGDYFRAEAGTLHDYTYTETGTTFLVIAHNELI